jgi:hypothetical protein
MQAHMKPKEGALLPDTHGQKQELSLLTCLDLGRANHLRYVQRRIPKDGPSRGKGVTPPTFDLESG